MSTMINHPVPADQLVSLAETLGIDSSYVNQQGETISISVETLRQHLQAMGVPVEDAEVLHNYQTQQFEASWQHIVPPIYVVRAEDLANTVILVTLPIDQETQPCPWTFHAEDGSTQQGELIAAQLPKQNEQTISGQAMARYAFPLPVQPHWGYHTLTIGKDTMRLIVVPSQCYFPPTLAQGDRIWGPSVQLYALRSKRNWGIGDFTDLANLVEWSASEGANIIGVNPLHALSLINPQDASPYSPSHRRFLNVLYLSIDQIPEFYDCKAVRQLVLSTDFQDKLDQLQNTDLVDYVGVFQAKWRVLDQLYRYFIDNHLSKNTPRAEAFRQYITEKGQTLYQFSVYEALLDYFHQENHDLWGWPVWPEAYQRFDSPDVSAFAEANQEKITFYQYLQWLAETQLAEVGSLSLKKGLTVGLYLDMAVGLNKGGAEVWANPDYFALDTTVGAPADDFAAIGQNWGLPPWIPQRLRAAGYQPFIDTLRETMHYAGAIRIDHIMGLMRLFWIPPGETALAGTYVQYPFDDLLGILALESHRNQTLIIGEDLGTVPHLVREKMREWHILSNRIFYFEKNKEGQFKPPTDYPETALVSLSNADLPTLSGFWMGQANTVRHKLGLLPQTTTSESESQLKEMLLDRMHFLTALERESLLPPEMTADPVSVGQLSDELCQAIYVYLAQTPCKILLVQFEDILGQLDQVNLPGTTHDVYPNWRRKLSMYIEDLPSNTRVKTLYALLQAERQSSQKRHDPLPQIKNEQAQLADIPQCTYRFQFNKTFKFNDALALVPYLKKLGMSHCYASPLLTAHPGSMHGYDIINHNQVNPEIGTHEEFNALSDSLKAHGMGLVVDIVPNHMGIGTDNVWWMDVLENGPASEYADYFDIDWSSVKEELYGKVLLPVLGEQYGAVLENGELQVEFMASEGLFTLHYYDHFWPINPNAYPIILNHRISTLSTRLSETSPAFLEYQSIVTAFEHLPIHTNLRPDAIAERRREKLIAIKRLSDLCMREPEIASFIQEDLADFNAVKSNPVSRKRLHQLLEAQAYRLAYWRVASDEINYRRFFDVNDLAGLRMELPQVFLDTHHLIFQWVQEGRITGLRIDHPDGLFDPAAYFTCLQEEALRVKGLEINNLTLDNTRLPFYIIVEKILAAYERLPDNWLVQGTTGYEFGNLLTGVFIDQHNEKAFNDLYRKIAPNEGISEMIYQCKRLIMRVSLSSELNVLAHQLNRLSEQDWRCRDFTLNNLRLALAEVVACFPVYRTYITPTTISKKDQDYVEWAVNAAKRRSVTLDHSIFDFIRSVLLLEHGKESDPAYHENVTRFAMRVQQFTGPVMAKGLEDTFFYRYNRLVAMNEVGGELQNFGTSLSAFHRQNSDRLKNNPHTMLNTSTHDSKRSEDVRARIAVLSEIPDIWQKYWKRWHRLNRLKRVAIDDMMVPDANNEYLLYQTLVGVWPFQSSMKTEEDYKALSERVEAYLLKASREAKVYTSWLNQNTPYEEGLSKFIRTLLTPGDGNHFLDDFLPFQQDITFFGMLNSLSQTLLKLTVPGVPDIYQGNELWDFSLVDPDNRRPIDFGRRQQLLEEIDPLVKGTLGDSVQRIAMLDDMLNHYEDGRLKLFITAVGLNFRSQHPAPFAEGDYIPLEVKGEKADHVVAFARQFADQTAIIIAPRLVYTLTEGETVMPTTKRIWKDTTVTFNVNLPYGKLQNLLTGEQFTVSKTPIPLSQLLNTFPIGYFMEVPTD